MWASRCRAFSRSFHHVDFPSSVTARRRIGRRTAVVRGRPRPVRRGQRFRSGAWCLSPGDQRFASHRAVRRRGLSARRADERHRPGAGRKLAARRPRAANAQGRADGGQRLSGALGRRAGAGRCRHRRLLRPKPGPGAGQPARRRGAARGRAPRAVDARPPRPPVRPAHRRRTGGLPQCHGVAVGGRRRVLAEHHHARQDARADAPAVRHGTPGGGTVPGGRALQGVSAGRCVAGRRRAGGLGRPQPGHTSWLFRGAAGQSPLLVWGDIVHYHAVQFRQPGVSYEHDSDRRQAVAARKRVLAQAASQGWWVAGAHLPFPGIGHVRSEGRAGYAWVPAEFGPTATAP